MSTDLLPTLAPVPVDRTPSPRAGHRVRPFEGFGPSFAWGLRTGLRGRRFLLVLIVSAALGALLGTEGFSGSRAYDPAFSLWDALDRAVLKYAVPLIALVLVAFGYGREVHERTLVFHLVRPVSRRTVFLSRCASGLVGGCLATTALVVALLAFADVPLAAEAWVGAVASCVAGTVVLGVLYFVLAALWRFGAIAALLYTFIVESVVSTTLGSVQKVAIGFHVRSLLHRLTDDALVAHMRAVNAKSVQATAQAGGASGAASGVFTPAERIAWDEPGQAIFVLLAVAVVALLVGGVAVSRRDYALKD